MPALSRARESARRSVCISNQKQVGLAIQMYVNANHDMLPGRTSGMVSSFFAYAPMSTPCGAGGWDVSPYLYWGALIKPGLLNLDSWRTLFCPSQEYQGENWRIPQCLVSNWRAPTYTYLGYAMYQTGNACSGGTFVGYSRLVAHRTVANGYKFVATDPYVACLYAPAATNYETWCHQKRGYNVLFLDGHVAWAKGRPSLSGYPTSADETHWRSAFWTWVFDAVQ